MATATVPSQQIQYMQGVGVPASSVRPAEFFAKTRRKNFLESAKNYSSVTSNQDVWELRKSDILAVLTLRFVGNLVLSASTTLSYRWPYDLLKGVRFTANGASNIINCSGLKLKAREQMRRGDETDRGISRTFGPGTITNGSLSLASEQWAAAAGGPGATLAAGTYPVDLTWHVPVAEDEIDLAGAIFLATSTSDLTLTVDYEQPVNLFSVPANATLTGTMSVVSTKYSIPYGSDGNIVVPNLNVFHSLTQSATASLQNGDNEVRLVGQGAGKSLLRVYYQLWNGPTATAFPLAMTAANFGKQSWRFGNNETPDEYPDGSFLRAMNERTFNSDVGGAWGFGVHDFAAENAFRDVVDMGTTGELRLVSAIAAGVTLNNPRLEYVTETVFQAGQAA